MDLNTSDGSQYVQSEYSIKLERWCRRKTRWPIETKLILKIRVSNLPKDMHLRFSILVQVQTV